MLEHIFAAKHMQFGNQKPMIRRYCLFHHICIHIVQSMDLHPHNHPWNYFTFILWGGYQELIYDPDNNFKVKEAHVRRMGWFTIRNKDVFHGLTPLNGKYNISLFINGRAKQESQFRHEGKLITLKRLIGVMGVPKELYKETYARILHWV